MFGNRKEELMNELRNEMKADMDSIKREYISQITCCEDIVKTAQDIIKKAEEGICRAEKNSECLRMEFEHVMEVVTARDENAKVFVDQKNRIDLLSAQIKQLQDDLEKANKKLKEMEKTGASAYIPPAESEYAALHYV